jgi:hypothetical protein
MTLSDGSLAAIQEPYPTLHLLDSPPNLRGESPRSVHCQARNPAEGSESPGKQRSEIESDAHTWGFIEAKEVLRAPRSTGNQRPKRHRHFLACRDHNSPKRALIVVERCNRARAEMKLENKQWTPAVPGTSHETVDRVRQCAAERLQLIRDDDGRYTGLD